MPSMRGGLFACRSTIRLSALPRRQGLSRFLEMAGNSTRSWQQVQCRNEKEFRKYATFKPPSVVEADCAPSVYEPAVTELHPLVLHPPRRYPRRRHPPRRFALAVAARVTSLHLQIIRALARRGATFATPGARRAPRNSSTVIKRRPGGSAAALAMASRTDFK